MPAPGVRIAIRTSIAGFQLTVQLGTLRLHVGRPASQDDGIHRRTPVQRMAQQGSMHAGKSPQHGVQSNCAPDSYRAPTRLAVLRRRLEAADTGVVSGGAGGSNVTTTATAPALGTGQVLESLKLTAEEPDDSFLLRWLRSRRDDVDEAEAAVRTHAAWRAHSVPVGGIGEVCALCVHKGGTSGSSAASGHIRLRMVLQQESGH